MCQSRHTPLLFLEDFGFILNLALRSLDGYLHILPLFALALHFVILGILAVNIIYVVLLAPLADHSVLATTILAEFFKNPCAPFRSIVKENPFPILIPQSAPLSTHSSREKFVIAEVH